MMSQIRSRIEYLTPTVTLCSCWGNNFRDLIFSCNLLAVRPLPIGSVLWEFHGAIISM